MNGTNGSGAKCRVWFTHSRDSRREEVEVGPALTGQKAIDGLVGMKFIEPPDGKRNYALALERTGDQIALSKTLSAAGVRDGDVVLVTETNVGAGVG